MSATPRTDAAECEVEEFDCHALVVTADLSRALETELNAVRLKLAEECEQNAHASKSWTAVAQLHARAAMLRDLTQPVDLTKL